MITPSNVKGRLIFVRGKSPLARLIRFFDKGEITHCGIMLDDNIILDARFFGGVKRRLNNYPDYEIVEVDGLDIERALSHVNKRYDLFRFIWYGFRYGDKVWNNPNQMICSELVGEAMHDDYIKDLTPNQQYKYFKELNGK